MIFLKTEDEIELLRASNLLVGKTLAQIAKVIKPGVTTKELDRVAEEFIRENGAVPTFKGFPNQYGAPFPASICTSVNEQVVHGIPGDIVLKEGDIVSVDCGTSVSYTHLINHSISPLENPAQIKQLRRTIARMKTELRERELNNK